MNSVRIAAVTTVVCLVIGFPIAYALTRRALAIRQALLILVIAQLCIAVMVRSYAWMPLLGNNGYLSALLPVDGFSFVVYLGIVHVYLPVMILCLYAGLRRFSYALVEAARDMGAGSLQVFRRIILPLSRTGVIAGCALVFAAVTGESVVPILLGRLDDPILGAEIGWNFFDTENWSASAAMFGVLFSIVAIPAILLYIAVLRPLVRQLSQDAADLDARQRGRGNRSLTICLYAGLTFLYLPIVALILNTISAGNFFSMEWADAELLASLRNSLVVAGLSATLATVLGVPAGLALVRWRGGRLFFSTLLTAPLWLPPVLAGLAFAFLLAFLGQFGAGTFGPGFVAVCIAHTTVGLPLVAIAVAVAQYRHGRLLEAAARDLGATPWTVILRITMPLIAPAMAAGWALAFLVSFNDPVIAAFVTAPERVTLPVEMFSEMAGGADPQMSAAAVLMALLVFGIAGVALLWLRSRGRASVDVTTE